MANSVDGVDIAGSNNTVGGTQADAGNVIGFNKKDGVEVSNASADAIHQNSIVGNGNLGIDLDGGTGNKNTRAPTLSLASYNPSAKTLTITGSITGTANTPFTLEFFASAVPVAQLVAQGTFYLDNLVVTTSATGTKTFTATITSLPAAFSSTTTPIITATATDLTGDTSPFSIGVVDPVVATPKLAPKVQMPGRERKL